MPQGHCFGVGGIGCRLPVSCCQFSGLTDDLCWRLRCKIVGIEHKVWENKRDRGDKDIREIREEDRWEGGGIFNCPGL